MPQLVSNLMSQRLKPLCTRDNHAMHYEENGIHWKDARGETQAQASYHCRYLGCSVRYTPAQGYFTVVKVPEEPYFIAEPGTNTLKCPTHETWLFRTRSGDRHIWRCGIENCDYLHDDTPAIWLQE